MEGFLTFILIFVLFIWVMGKLFPLLLAWLIKKRLNKMGGNFGQQSSRGYKQRYKEGDVIVEADRPKDKIVDDNIGEYIDFEESNTK